MKRIIPLLAVAGLSAGCIVQSFHPFCSKSAAVPVPELRGDYQLVTAWGEDVSDQNIQPWVFREQDVTTYDSTNVAATVKLTYFKLGDTLLCDSEPGDYQPGTVGWFGFWHTTPVHTLCKVELTGDTVRFVPLNLKWLLDQLTTGQVGLAHVKHPHTDEWALFTVTTEQWTEFLRKHVGTQVAFAEEHAYVLKKRVPTPSP